MAGRIRSIKPETLDDEKTASLSDGAWRLWVSMWLLADDHGRLRGGAAWLRAQVWWAHPDRTEKDVAGYLAELEQRNMSLPYEIDGQRYAAIRTWKKHQKVDHPSQPRIPFVASIKQLQELAVFPRETVANSSTALAPDLRSPISDQDLRPVPPTNDQPRTRVGLPVGWLDGLYSKFPRKGDKAKGATALEVLTAEERTRFSAAVSAYAQKVADENTPPRYVTTWPVFCAEKWRDYADGDTSPRRKTNGEVRAPVDKTQTRKERL